MYNREKEIIDSTVKILVKFMNPSKITLFGSRAKGNNSKNSDFDFAVHTKKPSISRQREIKDAVDSVIGLYKADIVYLLSVSEEFRHIVNNTGRVVYEKRN
ncbi:MAG: nucleotidyltransferase domain-containing protein [Candidatus Omnitrophica bacterium]|nr:nucleotidyltransferase domain-containing protein [Candidatus Omnitrophota bacterium]MDD5440775.1 nucleotidyltransferase domain-containing protein [Candidatus Omnitrophota bacterium]